LYPFRGRLLLEGVLEAVSGFNEILIICKNPLKFPSFKEVKFLVEWQEDFSPVYGILTALRYAKNEKILIVSGDLPLLSSNVLTAFSSCEPPAFIVDGSKNIL